MASVFNGGTPSTIYQQTATGATVTLDYDFFLWDKFGLPAIGVEMGIGSRRRGRRR